MTNSHIEYLDYNKSSALKLNFDFANFRWILFLGVLPIERAALTLYYSRTLGTVISISLNAIMVLLAFFALFSKEEKRIKSKLSLKYVMYFAITLAHYLIVGLYSEFTIERIFSLLCLLGCYLFVIYRYINIEDVLLDINKAIFFLIAISMILYFMGDSNVIYDAGDNIYTLKGVVPNRNTLSELTLFYIAISFYLFKKSKSLKSQVHFVLKISLAIYATVLTKSATSVICLVLLLFLLFANEYKFIKKLCSFKLFLFVYFIVFFLVVIFQISDSAIWRGITSFFEKSSTLTGRTYIWQISKHLIMERPLLGYGFDNHILANNGVELNDPHNGILYTLLTQGFLGLLLFFAMIFFVIINDGNKKIINDKCYMTMQIFLIVELIKGLVESIFSYPHIVFWISLIVMEYIINKKEVT